MFIRQTKKGGVRLGKLIVFTGESGSGKTTIIEELVRKYPDQFKRIVTNTSRPMRYGEIDGVDYNFRPEEYFISNYDLVFVKKTSEGFYYATRKAGLCLDTHNLLLTLRIAGIKSLINLGCQHMVVVRISISEQLKIDRMRQRGDNEKMILDRLRVDLENKGEVDLWEIPTIDLDASQTTEEQVDFILKHIY